MKNAVDDHHRRAMRLALAQAELAARVGEVPVGAYLQLADGRAFAAHNRPIADRDASAHAEVRVIRQACQAARNYRLPGATLYVTLEPCLMCAGLILHARINVLVYGARDPKTGAVHSLYQVLQDARLNHQVRIVEGCLAEESASLLRGFFRQRRGRGKADASLRETEGGLEVPGKPNGGHE